MVFPSASVMVCTRLGLNVWMLEVRRSGRTAFWSPYPEGPGPFCGSPDEKTDMSIGEPDCILRIGYKVQPSINLFGPFVHIWSKGNVQPPLNTKRYGESISELPYSALGLAAGKWMSAVAFLESHSDPLSRLCDQVKEAVKNVLPKCRTFPVCLVKLATKAL